MNRKLPLFCAGILVCALAHAAAPNLVNYQGRLTDIAGNPVPDGNYSVTFTVYLDSVGAASVWSETQNVTTTDGLFAVMLGAVAPFTPSAFSDSVRYLGIQIGGDPEIMPRSRLASVPFALHTTNSTGWVDGGSTVHLKSSADRVGIGLTSASLAKLHLHDTTNTINGVRMSLTQEFSGKGVLDGLALIYSPSGGYLWNYENGPLRFGTNNLEAMRIDSLGRVGIGNPNPAGALDVASTTGALIVPRMTTAQRDAFPPVNGMIIYNTTTNQFNFRENGAWVTK